MMNEENKKYREMHGVVKELDFVNYKDPYSNMSETEVQHSKYTDVSTTKTQGMGTAAKGMLKAGFGLLGAVSGGGMMSSGMAGEGVGDVIRGVGNKSTMHQIASNVTNEIIEAENRAWKYLEFARSFVPASGNIGDVIFKDGSCDDFHCGNGHRFFDNGDYFEGYFEDGEIKNGIYIFENGTRYLGNFDENHLQTGEGFFLYPDGTYYFGGLSNGMFHGFGFRLYPDGAFVGNFENNLRTNGCLRLENGSCFLGDFENDQPVR